MLNTFNRELAFCYFFNSELKQTRIGKRKYITYKSYIQPTTINYFILATIHLIHYCAGLNISLRKQLHCDMT